MQKSQVETMLSLSLSEEERKNIIENWVNNYSLGFSFEFIDRNYIKLRKMNQIYINESNETEFETEYIISKVFYLLEYTLKNKKGLYKAILLAINNDDLSLEEMIELVDDHVIGNSGSMEREITLGDYNLHTFKKCLNYNRFNFDYIKVFDKKYLEKIINYKNTLYLV